MHLAFEPFTTPVPHSVRLQRLVDAGAAAAVCIDPKDGRRVEYHNAGDWTVPEEAEAPLAVCDDIARARSVVAQDCRCG